jgi:hypothetical protein
MSFHCKMEAPDHTRPAIVAVIDFYFHNFITGS